MKKIILAGALALALSACAAVTNKINAFDTLARLADDHPGGGQPEKHDDFAHLRGRQRFGARPADHQGGRRQRDGGDPRRAERLRRLRRAMQRARRNGGGSACTGTLRRAEATSAREVARACAAALAAFRRRRVRRRRARGRGASRGNDDIDANSIGRRASPLAAALSGLESLSAKLAALRAALAAAAAKAWRDPTADVMAADDLAMLITQALADVGCPGAAAALDIETLIAKLAPARSRRCNG